MKRTRIITYLFLFLAMSQFVIAGEGNPVLNGVTTTPFYSSNYTINIHLTANDTINVNNGVVLIYDTNNSLLDSVKTVNGHATAQFSMTSIDNGRTGVLPDRYEIKAGPNPFNPHTTIRFSVPFRGNYRVDVYDILGRHVRQLELEHGEKLEPGTYSVLFDGENKFGQKISSGVYIYILKDISRGKIYSGKMSMPKGYKSEFKSALLQSKRTIAQTCDLDSPEMREFIVKALNDPNTDPKINETVMSMFAAGDTTWHINAGKNHKPLIEENYITPGQPLTIDTLFANFYITDEDGDEITPEVKWLVNGNNVHTGERLVPGNYNADDIVKTIVSAYDGKETATDTSDAVVVQPLRLFGKVLNNETELSQQGYVKIGNALIPTDNLGRFSSEINPQDLITINAQGYNNGNPVTYMRTRKVVGNAEQDSIFIKVVPYPKESTGVDAQLFRDFCWEANFRDEGPGVEGLKKIDFDNASRDFVYWISRYTPVIEDTFSVAEQEFVRDIIMDSIYQYIENPEHKPQIYIATLEDTIPAGPDPVLKPNKYGYGIIYKRRSGNPSIAVYDDDTDGILEKSAIFLTYGGPSATAGILQETLSWLVAPNQVRNEALNNKTVLRESQYASSLQPIDVKLIKLCEDYRQKEQIENILGMGTIQ